VGGIEFGCGEEIGGTAGGGEEGNERYREGGR
jgi:hypothetical protein